MKTLTNTTAKIGLVILCTEHPEWGTFRLDRDRNGWVRVGDSGRAMLNEGEFHFWESIIIVGDSLRCCLCDCRFIATHIDVTEQEKYRPTCPNCR